MDFRRAAEMNMEKLRMNKQAYIKLAGVAMILASLVLAGCKPETLKVGVILPLSGPNQAAGEAALKGIELALADLNEPSEGRIELLVRDSAGDPEAAARLLTELYKSEKAVAAIGGLSAAEARALTRVAEAEEKILMLPSVGDQRLAESSKHVYRLSVSDAEIGSKLASFAKQDLRTTTAIVLAQDDRFVETMSEGFQPTFENLKGEVIDRIDASAQGEDLAPTIEEVRVKDPGVVVLNGDGPWLEETVQKLKDARFKGKILAPQSFANPATLESMGSRARGVLFAYSPIDTKREQGQAFIEKYTSAHGEPPSHLAAEGYDSLQVLANAAVGRPAIASELRRGLRDAIKEYPGVTGSLEFNDSGAVQRFPRVYSLSKELTFRDHQDLIQRLRDEREAKIRELKDKLNRVGTD